MERPKISNYVSDVSMIPRSTKQTLLQSWCMLYIVMIGKRGLVMACVIKLEHIIYLSWFFCLVDLLPGLFCPIDFSINNLDLPKKLFD